MPWANKLGILSVISAVHKTNSDSKCRFIHMSGPVRNKPKAWN